MRDVLTKFAQGVIDRRHLDIPQTALDVTNQDNPISRALQLVFGIAGGVALLIITIAGFKYVLSQGNPQETAKAKNTILYALIGLIVCIMAFSIVSFVMGNI